MTVQEAKQILNLSDHSTEEDLKNNYKKEITRWHPDICKLPNAEEHTKKINEAKEILHNYFKHTKYQQTYNNSHSNVDYSSTASAYYNYYKQAYQNKQNFDAYITGLRNKLYAQYLNIYNDGNLDSITKNTIDMIKLAIKSFEAKASLAIKQNDIDTSYQYAKMQIDIILQSYINAYCHEYYIECDIANHIDISKGIAEAYRTLKKEKDRHFINKVQNVVKQPTEFIKKKMKKLF